MDMRQGDAGKRRGGFPFAAKRHAREGKGAAKTIDGMPGRLSCDSAYALFFHRVQYRDEPDRILGPDGAPQSFEKAERRGKFRFFGAQGHGAPGG